MKSKIKYTYQIYKKTVNTTNFILLFCLSIVGSFFGVFGCALGDIYLEGFFSIFWNENYGGSSEEVERVLLEGVAVKIKYLKYSKIIVACEILNDNA